MNLPVLATGFASGFLAGLLGVGGGIVTIFGLVTFVHTRQHVAHATSLAAIPPIALVGGVVFAAAGYIDKDVALPLIAGSLIGVLMGARMMINISPERLQRALGVATLLIGIRLLMT